MTNRPPRMLIYSHNSFGLGHLRRCRAIAQSLVAYRDDLSILMIAGSPIVGAFSFSPNVDFIRVPGVVKLANESYQPHSPGISIEDLMAIRSAIILETARVFEPDIFLVDKEPLGLRGEVEATLHFLKEKESSWCSAFATSWTTRRGSPRNGTASARCRRSKTSTITSGSTAFRRSAIRSTGIAVSDAVRQKTRFTGYLRRGKTPSGFYPAPHEIEEPFYLVTTGGGGDGAMLVDWVLRAYEFDPTLDMPAKIVLGPFMGTSQQTGFMERVARLKHIEAITFEANMEALMQRALAVVAMGGYNTFCEILSLDKRALILPRTAPRAEQFIRATRAEPSSGSSRCSCPTTPPTRARWSRRCAPFPTGAGRRRSTYRACSTGSPSSTALSTSISAPPCRPARGRRAFGRRRGRVSGSAWAEPHATSDCGYEDARVSRLDFMISRLTAQRALMEEAARLIADQPGPVFELGLGSGRTFDHLRQLLPSREIFAFDRAISAHPKCIPDGDHLILGEIRETLQFCAPRIPGKPAFIHVDLGSRRSDAGSDHARLAVAAHHRMVGARDDHSGRPAARRRIPRSAAAARLPEIRPRAASRRVSGGERHATADAHSLLRAVEAARPSRRLGRPRDGAGADRGARARRPRGGARLAFPQLRFRRPAGARRGFANEGQKIAHRYLRQDRARRAAARSLVHLPPLSQGAGLARPDRRASGSAFPTRSPRPPTRRSRRAAAGTSGTARWRTRSARPR